MSGMGFTLFKRKEKNMLKEIKKGFTLAEVLIVIGIIGVVAALTLPNLNHATGDKETGTKVKKIYSTLTEAFDRAQVIYGNADTWFKDLNDDDYAAKSERAAKRITEFMKVSKDCGFEAGCFSSGPLLETDGSEYSDAENYLESLQSGHTYMVTLADGISLGFSRSKIRVDIDGQKKKKNQAGKDLFDFTFYTFESEASSHGANLNQIYPSAQPNSWKEDLATQYATAWVIENSNLGYLKCPEELNWETKTSCE